MMTCPCIVAFDLPEFCEGHTEPVIAVARQLAEIYQPIPVSDEQVGWFMADARTVVDELGDGPFETVENAEGLKADGYPRYGFDGTAFIVDDVWFAVLSGKDGSDTVRLTDEESTALWQFSVGERAADGGNR